MIYLDNASTTFPKPPVIARTIVHAIEHFGNAMRGSHSCSLDALRSVEAARDDVAALFNCRPERVAFTKNATEAVNIAVASLDGHIITTEAEHNAVLRPLYRHGTIDIARVDERGRYGLDDIAALRRPDTAAVVVAHGSNLTGNLAPVADIGRWCRENGILFVLDAAQTAGLLDIDMEALAVDALCFSGHKSLYALQGTGGICVGESFPARPFIVGGSGVDTFRKTQPDELPTRLEAGTLNSHGIATMAVGIAYVREHTPAALLGKAASLARSFYDAVAGADAVVTYGDYDAGIRLPIVTLNVGDMDSADVATILSDEYGIAIRSGSHCAPLLHERFGTRRQGAARFSFSHLNTPEEAELAAEAVLALSRRLAGSR
ncbi:MAG: aminotransferase class V-fold PLP-dependent enzyme [Planctomycetes bacterium]|nr:aminotransferase class V-fold PLP-dependent enzyme [Planctomycetota bacterium]